ncbi:transglutaminase domain-containing protein [Ornithinibacillus californiensis]|uniref:transglutaminase domain-containing protein n=1 Tax=Ornithinibacillus californiensis TaxID=161536 RepID=UPI00069D5964|nr:transglutaminase domain-containing protein [Ornithinibacillus californiensis]
MSKLNKTNIPFIYTSILYLAGLLLFLEWLYPVEEVTDTAFIGIFIIYAFFCFFISLLQVKWWLSFILKGFGIFFILNGLYSTNSFWSKLWIQEFYTDIIYNIESLLARQWFDLSNMFRSLLFLFIIWLMSYLIFYWFVQVKRVMVFSVLTFVYITLLDTFTVYNADWAILRTFIIAFLALGLANVLKEIQKENLQTYRLSAKPLWILPLIMIVLFSSMVGYAAPKLEPQWADPVPYLEGVFNGNGIGGNGVGTVQKVGYGENDSRLGGSFVQDYTPVFQAYMKEDSYFRVESKDYYTGKGWVNSDRGDYVEQANGDITFETFSPNIETEEQHVRLEFDGRAFIPKLIYPYGTKHVVPSNENASFMLDEQSGEIKTQVDDREIVLANYEISFDKPTYPIDLMRKSETPTELDNQYTRVPPSLPDRVGELAAEITSGYDNQYDKVRAIERYFSGNGFVYQISNVAVPSENQDYVDQFLFDTKVGYCDNFSTSMVVMLRTLDIPARWVKGFTSGEKVQDNVNEEGDNLYQVTNANAHSWVEVYFEGVGWVPFEPTQGFNVPNSYSVDTSEEDDVLDAPEVTPPAPEHPEIPEQEAADAFNPSDSSQTKLEFTKVHGIILGVVLLILVGLLIWKRHQLRIYLLERKMQKRKDAATYQDAYHYVLKLLKNKGFQKEPDQTLREYATRIDSWYGSDEMGRLTADYERLIYQNNLSTIVDDELSNLWKNLIKRILG